MPVLLVNRTCEDSKPLFLYRFPHSTPTPQSVVERIKIGTELLMLMAFRQAFCSDKTASVQVPLRHCVDVRAGIGVGIGIGLGLTEAFRPIKCPLVVIERLAHAINLD